MFGRKISTRREQPSEAYEKHKPRWTSRLIDATYNRLLEYPCWCICSNEISRSFQRFQVSFKFYHLRSWQWSLVAVAMRTELQHESFLLRAFENFREQLYTIPNRVHSWASFSAAKETFHVKVHEGEPTISWSLSNRIRWEPGETRPRLDLLISGHVGAN